MRRSIQAVAVGCILWACSVSGPDVGPVPGVDVTALGPSLAERFEPALSAALGAPENPELTGRAGMLLLAYSQHELAARFLERARGLDPRSFRWDYYLGVSLAAFGRHADAERSFRRCLQIDPEHAQTRRRLAEALFESGNLDESAELFRDALSASPDDPRSLLGLGRIAAAAGELEGARRNLERAVELAPEYGAAHYALALVYRDQGLDGASTGHMALFERHNGGEPPGLDPLMRAVRALRASAADYLQRGVEAQQTGRFEQAVQLHLRALDEDPELLRARTNLLILLGNAGRHEEAREQYRLGLASGSESAELHYNFGVVAYREGRREEAEAAFGKALSVNPDHALANHNLGQMREEAGRFGEAADLYRRALASRPAHGLSHYKLGMLAMRRRSADDAVRSFSEAIKEESDRRPTYLFSLAAAELASGDRDAATQRFRRARQEAQRYGQTELIERIDATLVQVEKAAIAR